MVKSLKNAIQACMLFATVVPAFAAGDGDSEKKVTLEVGADVVSSYIWRGADCGGFSVQPGATITWNRTGLSLGVWASAELFEKSEFANMTEFDLSGSYTVGSLTVGLTDYFFCDARYLSTWTWNSRSSHNLELNLAYDFGPVALAWNTVLTGANHQADGDRIYSSYVEVSAPFKLGGVDCTAVVGASPWEDSGFMSDTKKFNVINCSVSASKEVHGIPVSAQVTYNPYTEATYFVVGLSF